MVQLRAIRECPGHLPGTIFDAPEAAAEVLVELGAAEVVAEPTAQAPSPTPKRRYRRRDLEAE